MTVTSTTTDLPKVYIVASRTEHEYSGDVAGKLTTAEGEELWGHISSSPGFLRSDLTVAGGRGGMLAVRYPDGFDLVWLGPDDPRPWEAAAGKEERVAKVAGIITDLWPHRMSTAAATEIDAFYERELENHRAARARAELQRDAARHDAQRILGAASQAAAALRGIQ